MPELDAERRERLAALTAFHRCSDLHPERHDMGGVGVCHSCASWGRHVADALALLVAGWLADAWDAGYVAADHLTHRGVTHPCAAVDRDNPYRAGEGA